MWNSRWRLRQRGSEHSLRCGPESWEETGLIAALIGPKVGKDHIFSMRSGKIVCKFSPLVDAEKSETDELDVKLNLHEYQAFVWATEEEI